MLIFGKLETLRGDPESHSTKLSLKSMSHNFTVQKKEVEMEFYNHKLLQDSCSHIPDMIAVMLHRFDRLF